MGLKTHVTRRGVAALALAAAVLAGVGPALASGPSVTPAGVVAATLPCPTGITCVDIDATHVLGPVDLVAQGFLFGTDTTTSQWLINALHPTSWRLSSPGQTYNTAKASGASVTEILSNLWYDEHGPSQPPWANWAAYASWIHDTVASAAASGFEPDYWEIQNEPDGGYQALPPESTNQALYQYQLASTIIRQVDPRARIEGPSLLGFYDTPGQPTLDMATFLAFVNAYHLPLDALSWHEVIGTAVNRNSSVVGAHVAQARSLLAQYPRIAHIPIFINEYQSNPTHLIPGWAVGWIASLEASGVAAATRSCWHEPDVLGKPIAECNEGGLDGLLQPGSGLPQDLYWVHWAYAQMTGRRVATLSSDPAVSAYATYDAGRRRVMVLVGRHVSCTPTVRVDCAQPAWATPPPSSVRLRIRTPSGWTTSLVSSLRIGNVPGPMWLPSPATSLAIPSPLLTIPVGEPGFADGDAYAFTISNL